MRHACTTFASLFGFPVLVFALDGLTIMVLIVLLIHCILETFAATSDTSKRLFKLGLLLEKTPQSSDFQFAFDTLLDEINKNKAILPFADIKGVTMEWTNKASPLLLWENIQEKIINNNVSTVLSFLPLGKNQILVNALSRAAIPVIGLGLLAEKFYSSYKEGAMYLSMLPTEALQSNLITDLLLEFKEGRFVCITTHTASNDPILVHLFQRVATRGDSLPRCIVLRQNVMEELSIALTAIRASEVRVLLVHCSNDESITILNHVRRLSLQSLESDFIWIFTNKAITEDAGIFPEGSFGVRQATGESKHSSLHVQLLNDSVRLFAHGLEQALEGILPVKNLNHLEAEMSSSLKEQIYRNMLYSRAYGQTGPIEFSPTGERTAFKFTIVKVIRPPNGELQWHVMGSACPDWTINREPSMLEIFLPRDLPTPRRLRIVTIEHEPFTMIHEAQYSSKLGMSCPSSNTIPCTKFNVSNMASDRLTAPWSTTRQNYEIKCCYGVMIDILLLLQEIGKFTFDLYLVRDGKYGSFDPVTKEMNGMIGEVSREYADLALAMITITKGRSEYVDFTTPYIGTSLTFLVRRFKSRNKTFLESISDMRLMKPFNTGLWFMCAAAFFGVVFTVWVMEKVFYYRTHKTSYLLPFEFITYVFGNIFHVPLTTIQAKSHTVPFVMVVANFGGLVLVSSYTANLLASLIAVEEASIVSGIVDNKLVHPPEGFTFGTIKDSSTEDFFKNSHSSRLRQIHDNMEQHNVENFIDGIERVRSGEMTAFLGEYRALLHHVYEDPNCELKLDGLPFDLSGLAFALQKHSEWNQPISRAIHKLNERDIIPKIFQKWTVEGCQSSLQTVVPMGLSEFGGFLFNTAMITCGCFIILLAEILIYRRITRTRSSFSLAQNGFTFPMLSLPDSSSLTSILGIDHSNVPNI